MLLLIESSYTSEGDRVAGESGVADYWLVVLIPLLLCGVVYRKSGRRPGGIKAIPADVECGALEAISARAVLAEPGSMAFDDVIGVLLGVDPGGAQVLGTEDVMVCRSVQHPQHAILGAASDTSFIAPDYSDDTHSATVEPEVAPIKPIAVVPLSTGRDAYMTRSDSYEDIFVDVKDDPSLIKPIAGVSLAKERDVIMARSKSYEDIFTYDPSLAAVARTESYFDTLNTEAGDGPLLQTAATANPPSVVQFLLPNVKDLSASFNDRNSLFVDDTDTLRFKSVHRANPLAELAKHNRRVAVHADQLDDLNLDDLELHNSLFTLANLDPVDEMEVAGERNSVSQSGLGMQDLEHDVDAPECTVVPNCLIGLRAGRGGQSLDDQDDYLAVDPNDPAALRSGRGGQSVDDQDEYLAVDPNDPAALRAGRGGQSVDDQDEYLAVDPNDPAPLRAGRNGYSLYAGHGPATDICYGRSEAQRLGHEDDQDVYLAVDPNDPAALRTGRNGQSIHAGYGSATDIQFGRSEAQRFGREDDQNEYLAVDPNDPAALRAGRGGQSGDEKDEYLAVDPDDPRALLSSRSGHSFHAGHGPATDIQFGRSEAQRFGHEDDNENEYLAVDPDDPPAWAGLPSIGDDEEYLAVDVDRRSRASVRFGQSETEPFGTDDEREDEYLAVEWLAVAVDSPITFGSSDSTSPVAVTTARKQTAAWFVPNREEPAPVATVRPLNATAVAGKTRGSIKPSSNNMNVFYQQMVGTATSASSVDNEADELPPRFFGSRASGAGATAGDPRDMPTKSEAREATLNIEFDPARSSMFIDMPDDVQTEECEDAFDEIPSATKTEAREAALNIEFDPARSSLFVDIPDDVQTEECEDAFKVIPSAMLGPAGRKMMARESGRMFNDKVLKFARGTAPHAKLDDHGGGVLRSPSSESTTTI